MVVLLLNGTHYAMSKNGGTQYARQKYDGMQYARGRGVTLFCWAFSLTTVSIPVLLHIMHQSTFCI